MAEALQSLFPGIKFGIGPAIETGFYYDVDLGDKTITEADLKKIEDKMIELARQKEVFVRKDITKDEAMATYTEKGDEYKCDLIKDLEDGTITFYTNGGFTDLCRGPHIVDTSVIKAVKLTSIAGAYWRGNENNKMLTRIYGVTFPKKSMLDEYLQMLEEAKKRDHRKLGKELELFAFSQRVGAGLPLWLPRGAALREKLENFLKQVQKEVSKNFLLLAPTGLAAINLGGQTIHSFFGFKFGVLGPGETGQLNPKKQRLIREIDTIIID
jgi:threonyl-tRNA synthetase